MLKMKLKSILSLSLLFFACSHAPPNVQVLTPAPVPAPHEAAANIINQARIEKYSAIFGF